METKTKNKSKMSQSVVDECEYNLRLLNIAKKHGANTKILTKDRYRSLIEEIKQINLHGAKKSIDFRRNKKYALLKTPNGEERLFYKPAMTNNTKLLMVTLEETYDIVNNSHLNVTNHGGRSRMMDELKKVYYNVTTECLTLYLSMCPECGTKRGWSRSTSKQRKQKIDQCDDESLDDPEIEDPLEDLISLETDYEQQNAFQMEKNDVINKSVKKYPEMYSRAQMDLLTVMNDPTEEYKYMMVYRNHATKYIHLKAMAGISVDEAAEALLEIFLVFGAPNILQSKNGVAILKPICSRITALYPLIKVVYSEEVFPTTDFKEKSNEDILKKLNEWLIKTQNTKWQNGVKYIQHSLNTTFHTMICRTPSELVFGCNPSQGVASVLKDAWNVFSESDLETVLDSKYGHNDNNAKNNLLLKESLIIPRDLIKLEVEETNDVENLD